MTPPRRNPIAQRCRRARLRRESGSPARRPKEAPTRPTRAPERADFAKSVVSSECSLRRSLQDSGRSAPSRAASISQFTPITWRLSPLHIHAATLRDRLPATLIVAEAREREIYRATDRAEIDRVLKSYRDFVELCERKEAETGEPCLIVASY